MSIETEKRAHSYPRQPGSSIEVDEEEWNRKSPFGHCPACGGIGIEEGPSSECATALFCCSDEHCRSKVHDDMGWRIVHTKWSEKKTVDWRRREITERVSWNWEHFSEEFCIAYDLV